MNIEEIIKESVETTLKEKGISNNKVQTSVSNINSQSESIINESYVTQAAKFDLKTELLSDKNKKAHQELLEGYVENLNEISAKLDSADRDAAGLNHSEFRSLKVDEAYNHNATFLHGLFFQNISDVNSQITTDSLTFMRLERDFGSFDAWQEDFMACAKSARNGWAITAYNTQLKRYINLVIDLHSQNVMIGCHPVIVLDCWEHTYYRDYLKNRPAYIRGMMKELNWNVIEDRVKVADKIHKALS